MMTRNRLSVVLLCCFVSLGVLLPSIPEEVNTEPELSEEKYERALSDGEQPGFCSAMMTLKYNEAK